MSLLPLPVSFKNIDFSIDGVSIVLALLQVLAILKDHSKLHKDLYWKLLKVGR